MGFLHSFDTFSCCFSKGNRSKHYQNTPNFSACGGPISYYTPPLVRKVTLTRGGYNSLHESTPKIFGRLRRPKSTFMNLIDSLLSLFRAGPLQAENFGFVCTRLTRFPTVFKRKSIKGNCKRNPQELKIWRANRKYQ